MTLGTPSSNATLGSPTTNTLTITPDATPQPTVSFVNASQTVNENSGTFTVTVQLSAASEVDTTVPFTLGGTAVSGVDYSGVTTSPLVIPAGQTSATITGTLLADPEPNKTLTFTLQTPTNATLGATAMFTLTIVEPLTPNEHFVAALYQAELGRAADLSNPQDAGAFVNALDQGTLTQAAVAAAVEHSFEARDFLVKGWYVTFLGRQANGTEELGWVNLLVQGKTEEVVLGDILGDPGHEFYNRTQTSASTGDPNQNYVEGLYQLLLGRTAGAAEVGVWVNALPELGLQGVAEGIEASIEYRTDVVEDYYAALLHRPADAADLNGWVFSDLDLSSIRVDIESGPEFFSNG